MKRISCIVACMLVMALPLAAQGELDALRFSRESLYGTARAMSMANAFGALGGDQTGVNINPAGIAVYRSSEVAGTFNMSREGSTVGRLKANSSQLDMDNLGFVGYFPLRNDFITHINFGFIFNRSQSFNKNINAIGASKSNMIDFIADRSAGIFPGDLEFQDDYNPFIDQPWLAVLGYNAWLINPDNNQGDSYSSIQTPGLLSNEIRTVETGYLDNYDFTVGTSINNILNLGFSLSVKDISYRLASDYWEDYDKGWYRLSNGITASGAGVSAKFGAIYRPIHELRLGISYHTSTYYALSEIYEAEIEDDMGYYINDPEYVADKVSSKRFSNDYDLRTPGKFILSAATVLGSSFIASVDYELVDYRKMKLMIPSNKLDNSDWYKLDNEYISTDFKIASTVKAGMEYRFTPQLSARLGYAWMQNPYDVDFKTRANAGVAGSNTIFRMEGDTNYFTGGVGYRFSKSFFVDFAMVLKTQKDDLYPFPNQYNIMSSILPISTTPFKLTNSSLMGVVGFGYRF